MPVFHRFRERDTPAPSGSVKCGTLYTYDSAGNEVSKQDYVKSLSPRNTIEKVWDSKNLGPPYLAGGDFGKFSAFVDHNTLKGVGTYRTNPALLSQGVPLYVYKGGFLPPDLVEWFGISGAAVFDNVLSASSADPTTSTLYPSNMAILGEEALRKMSPKLEEAGMSVFLGELRDIPKMLRGTSKGFHDVWKAMGGKGRSHIMQPKGLADHFINHQFGWVPFLSDLRKFNNVYQNSAAYMARISHENGQWTKRRRRLYGTQTSTLMSQTGVAQVYPWGNQFSAMCNASVVNGQDAYAVTSRFYETIESNWSSGSVKYYRPEFDASLPGYNSGWNVLQRNLILYGARINPSVVWKLTPWSWLVDWHTNVGNTIERATAWANDSVVWQYHFVMSHVQNVFRHSVALNFAQGTQILDWHLVSDVKVREIGGSPFGFNFAGPLSARQAAILAALAISRKRP